ncbi:hypothetical protein [Alkaliphilus serpentinus]|uniref:Uncharacterized protein n=1 Tax=Alkaliphilus serpentinus TaxID=1482731 RepID=A0A833HP91_9FIRM|nr:hypothetical protein [Alkaliphilus serpentinus]KAB3530534.1 hypothetical protein F8153_06700 [Alkaliphilus serpentinus]
MANPLTRVIMNNIAGKSIPNHKGTSNEITTSLKDHEEQLLKGIINKNKRVDNIRDKSYSTNRPQQVHLTSLTELASKSSKNPEMLEDPGKEGFTPPVKNDVMVKKHVIAGNHVDLLSLGSMAKKGSIK